MLSWGTIAYGAALSAVLGVLLALVARERRPLVLVAVAVGAGGGPVAWNAQFFVDARFRRFQSAGRTLGPVYSRSPPLPSSSPPRCHPPARRAGSPDWPCWEVSARCSSTSTFTELSLACTTPSPHSKRSCRP
jgi:hypothetical protein